MKFKKNVAIDFDGVLNKYKGYDPDNLYEPREGVRDFLEELNKEYTVIIYTTRVRFHVEQWLHKHRLNKLVHEVSNNKPPAVAYIDDRALCFTGDYKEALEQLGRFKAYWEK